MIAVSRPRCCQVVGWPYVIFAALALILSLWRKINPLFILVGGLALGAFTGIIGW